MGQVILGDCLEVMRKLPDNFVGLVYLDPPFFTQRTHVLKTRDLTDEYQFEDHWSDLHEYLHFLEVRLVEMKRLMHDQASIFFHCDKTASHHIRLLLDRVFGADRFLSEIIWIYRRWSNSKRTLLSSHQTIFMYSKTENYTFNPLIQEYSETTNLDQILQKRIRNDSGRTVYARSDDGDIILNGPKRGVPLTDTWEIPYLNPKAKERNGYPTQKPVLLLERIITLASDSQDVVLDPFMGSGTTLVAAARLEREFIGIDISEKAVQLARRRLQKPIKSESKLLQSGRSAYDNLPNDVKTLLSSLPVQLVQRNSGIDAFYNEFIDGFPIVIRVQRKGERLSDAASQLARSGRKARAKLMILVQTDDSYQDTLFDLIPEEVITVKSTHIAIKEAITELMRNLNR